ncbi:hypothetical protein GCM10010193_68880 [Kitasatospora atroaurantiaca]
MDAVRGLDVVDADRVVVSGASQGGGVALAAAALADGLVAGAMIDVPFLQHFRRAVEVAGSGPYPEITDYLRRHSRDKVAQTFRTLSYFDGVHLASRASAPALFSVGLMDPVCPPSTVFASYNRYGGEREIEVWEFADHGGGQASQERRQLEWLRDHGLGVKGWASARRLRPGTCGRRRSGSASGCRPSRPAACRW